MMESCVRTQGCQERTDVGRAVFEHDSVDESFSFALPWTGAGYIGLVLTPTGLHTLRRPVKSRLNNVG